MGAHVNRETVLVQLDCSCTRTFVQPAPRTGDVLWCPRHSVEAEVVTGLTVYRFQCHSCRHARSFGRFIETPRKRASSHVRAHPGHVVGLYNGNKFVEDIHQDNMTPLLDLPANHSTQLREAVERYQTVTQKPHDKLPPEGTGDYTEPSDRHKQSGPMIEDHHSAGRGPGMKVTEDHEGFPF